MKPVRPVFLDLRRIRQPLPAVISILHRGSGALLFLALPWLLYTWQESLASEQAFLRVQHSTNWRLASFLAGSAFAYHFFAGLRFLLLDLRWGLSLGAARRASVWVLAATALCSLGLAVWLW